MATPVNKSDLLCRLLSRLLSTCCVGCCVVVVYSFYKGWAYAQERAGVPYVGSGAAPAGSCPGLLDGPAMAVGWGLGWDGAGVVT